MVESLDLNADRRAMTDSTSVQNGTDANDVYLGLQVR